MFLVAGLGNPGTQYEMTRHNAGFLVIDELADELGAGSLREKFQGRFQKVPRSAGADVVLLKPMTFMNLSGQSVQPALSFFGIPAAKLIVVHDELDLPYGELRIKVGGGLAGHNGLRSIVQQLGVQEFIRLRFGVGRPGGKSGRNHVLGGFGAEEREALPSLLAQAAKMVLAVVDDGPVSAMNRFHTPKAPKKPKKKKEPEATGPGDGES